MFVIVGLGNPGKQYEHTRHNIGFDVVDVMASKYGISINKKKHKAYIGEGRIGIHKVLFVKPTTYMNLSGESLREILDFYQLTSKDFIVVYDDISLEVGKLRIRGKGSAGGHNGIKSIIQHFGGDSFPRVKVGVGGPLPNQDLADFVLQRFPKEQSQQLEVVIDKSIAAIEMMMNHSIEAAMNQFNG